MNFSAKIDGWIRLVENGIKNNVVKIRFMLIGKFIKIHNVKMTCFLEQCHFSLPDGYHR